MQERAWHHTYPAGVPREMTLSDDQTLVSLFEETARRHAARTPPAARAKA